MHRFSPATLCLALTLAAPLPTSAANFCIASGGGFGNGGTSYVAPSFTLPAKNHCTPWAGYTKTASTVIAIANGTGCLASDAKTLTFSIFDTDPDFFGAGSSGSDYISICPTGTGGCTASGQDSGTFSGSAAEQTCTSALLKLPPMHD